MQKIHFIGIGGIGASSLAQILHKKGATISGSDQTASAITKNLQQRGIKVNIGHNTKAIPQKCNLVIYSPAIPPNNPELKEAKKRKIKTLSYPQALGELSKDYFTIAIAGTHGKSTTTAMTALILKEAGLDPTVIIGTKVKQLSNRNFRVGKGEYLVVEACEYKKSFLSLKPNILVITNLEADHLDYFKNLKNYKEAFKKLVKKVPKSGVVIIHTDKNLKDVTRDSKAPIIEWSKNNPIDIKLKVPGEFNLENATNAAVAGQVIGVDQKHIKKALENFRGTWRRMEDKSKKGYKSRFIDDYGHHPTEIKMTLKAIREENPKSKILTVFQPHQYSRTKKLLKDFGKSFTDSDKTIIPNIYQVRDKKEDIKKVSAQDLIKEIKKNGGKALFGDGLQKTAKFIKDNHSKYDIIITMGAGDITNIYKYL